MFSAKDYDLNREYRQDKMREAEQQRLATSAARPNRSRWNPVKAFWQAVQSAVRPRIQRAPQRAPQTRKSYRHVARSRS